MRLTNNCKKILLELFSASSGLFLFTLHRSLLLKPKEIFEAIENLQKDSLIEVNEDRVTITKEGVNYVISNGLIAPNTIPNNSNEFQNNITVYRLPINNFYIPRNFEY